MLHPEYVRLYGAPHAACTWPKEVCHNEAVYACTTNANLRCELHAPQVGGNAHEMKWLPQHRICIATGWRDDEEVEEDFNI